MKKPVVLWFILAFLVVSNQGYACKCPDQSIDREVDKAYDIVVGKVTSEKAEWVTCSYPEGGNNYEFTTSYLYTLQTSFSYKGNLSGTQVIQGGKGQGDCGEIFGVGKQYLIVVHKCDKGLYTYLCSDNAVLSEASSQVSFLNSHFGKNYEIESKGDNEKVLLIAVVAILALALIVFGFSMSHFRRKSIV